MKKKINFQLKWMWSMYICRRSVRVDDMRIYMSWNTMYRCSIHKFPETKKERQRSQKPPHRDMCNSWEWKCRVLMKREKNRVCERESRKNIIDERGGDLVKRKIVLLLIRTSSSSSKKKVVTTYMNKRREASKSRDIISHLTYLTHPTQKKQFTVKRERENER